MRTISFKETNYDLESVLNQVTEEAEGIVISRKDGKDVVVMCLSQYNGLMETLHLLGTSANAIHLMEPIRSFKKGRKDHSRSTGWDEFFDTETAFGKDFLEDRDEIVPQDRDID